MCTTVFAGELGASYTSYTRMSRSCGTAAALVTLSSRESR